MSVCRSCGKPILWARTAKGKLQPVDAAPDPNGSVELIPVGNDLASRVVADPKLYKGNPQALHMPHHATCIFADKHRTKKKR